MLCCLLEKSRLKTSSMISLAILIWPCSSCGLAIMSPPANCKSTLHLNDLIIWITLIHVLRNQPPNLVFVALCLLKNPSRQKDFRSVMHLYHSTGNSCCASTSIGSGASTNKSSSGVISLMDRAVPSSYATACFISTLIGKYFHICLITVLLAISP